MLQNLPVKAIGNLLATVGNVSSFLTYNRLKSYIAFFIAASVTLFLIPHLSHISRRLNLLDCPDQPRKMHSNPTPLVGGIAMAMGFIASTIFVLPASIFRGFFAGSIIILIIGFLDDFKEINHKWKFAAQIIASVVVIFYSGVVISSFGRLLRDTSIDLGWSAAPITIFCIVGVINAVNLIDGIDGLAGGISFIGFVSLAVFSYINQQKEMAYLSIALCGAIIGFLKFNWYPARVFMGDAGSLFLGFSLAYVSISVTQVQNTKVPPVAPLLVLAVPIVDTVVLLSKRLLAGRNPFTADKNHIHHIIHRFGVSKKWTTIILLAVSFLFSCIAIAGVLFKVPEYYLFNVFVTYAVLCLFLSFFVKRVLRFKRGE